MRKILYILIFILSLSLSYGQGVAINNDGSDSDASAILDVKSTTQGILYPRMTDAQRDAITSPVDGLTIFNTSSGCINYYFISGWYELCGSCTHTIKLYDSYGDGWHSNNFVTVRVNGVIVLNNIILVSGYGPTSYTFQAEKGEAIQITYTNGSWPYECYYSVESTNSTLVSNYYPNVSGTWNGLGICP
jgi:hypothetical protein